MIIMVTMNLMAAERRLQFVDREIESRRSIHGVVVFRVCIIETVQSKKHTKKYGEVHMSLQFPQEQETRVRIRTGYKR